MTDHGSNGPSLEDGGIFVSYRRDDSADVVGRILDRLKTTHDDREIFRDVDDIPLGVDFKEAIEQAIETAAVLLVAIGPRWDTITGEEGRRRLDDPNDFVRLEIQAALERDIPIIPLLVGGARMPGASDLPDPMRSLALRNGIQIRPDPDFDTDVGRLLTRLEQLEHAEDQEEVAELEAVVAAAEEREDWGAAAAALHRLSEFVPDRPGLAERAADLESRVAVASLTAQAVAAEGKGSWEEVLGLTGQIRSIDAGWPDPDGLETRARAQRTVVEALRLQASGDLQAALRTVRGALVVAPGLPAGVEAEAEIAAALDARRRRGRWLGAGAAFVLVVIAVAVAIALLGGDEVALAPDVVGTTGEAATAILEEQGMSVTIRAQPDDVVPAGTVISQDPGAGESATRVTIVVSSGPALPGTPEVPDLVGETEAAATEALEGLDIAVSVVRQPDDTFASGVVISQQPAAGARSDNVMILVSTGPAPADAPEVPDVVGETEAAATEALEELGIDVSAQTRPDDAIPEGTVISQSPQAGTRSSEVTIVISTGPELVAVPDLAGVSSAEAVVEGAGLVAVISEELSVTVPASATISQVPLPGTLVRVGSTVNVVVSLGGAETLLSDCIPYNVATLTIVDEGVSGWLLTDGGSRMKVLDDRQDAEAALALARRHTLQCFIGRDNVRSERLDYIVAYWAGVSGLVTTIENEDCLPYDPNALRIVDEGASGWLLTDGDSRMLILDNRSDAQLALDVGGLYSAHCFIGRGNSRPNRSSYILEYWR